MVIQNNKLMATSGSNGLAKIRNLEIDSKICIKAFGYYDTCLVLRKNESEIFLRPKLYETSEVTITANEESPKEQFLRFLTYSASLANQEEELRSYRFQIVYTPDTADVFDRMDGRFSYNCSSAKERHGFKDLYACSVEHKISKELFEDSIAKTSMNRGTLSSYMMNSYHIEYPSKRRFMKKFDERKLHRLRTDSAVYFTIVDSIVLPLKFIWKFNNDGRLLEFESIEILEESNRTILRNLGKKYTQYTFTKEGILRPEHINITQKYQTKTIFGYTSRISLSSENSICIEDKTTTIPVGFSVSTWAKYRNIPTTIIDE